MPLDNTETTNFAESLATLGLNASGNERRYLGQSSTVSFSRIISSSLLKAAPNKYHQALTDTTESEAQQFPCLLPNANSARALSDAYFRSIQQQYPFLHEPTFRAWEAELLTPGKEFTEAHHVPLFFLYAVGFYVSSLRATADLERSMQLPLSCFREVDTIQG